METISYLLTADINRRTIELSDESGLRLTALSYKRDSWFSTKYIGKADIYNDKFLLKGDKEAITLHLNDLKVGFANIDSQRKDRKVVCIEIENNIYYLETGNQSLRYTIVNERADTIMDMKILLERDKDCNLFGFLYFPSKMRHSVIAQAKGIDILRQILLLLVAGYCIIEIYYGVD